MDIPKITRTDSRGTTKLVENDEEEAHMAWQKRMSKFGVTKESTSSEQKVALLWALLSSQLPTDVKSIEKFFVHHVEYTLARDRFNLTPFSAFQALAYSVRDRLTERWKDTQHYFREKKVKRIAYLSMEYLLGRSLQNAVVNLGLEDNFGTALKNLGYVMEELYEQEHDAGLGNGGLGRLAACFLDSLATQDYPAWGYGLRYKYGMFHQQIKDHCQIEFPDYWLMYGNPWEIERLDVVFPIRFYGTVKEVELSNGKKKFVWEGGEKVLAVAYDTPIPGFDTYNTLNARLWSCRPTKEFDLSSFNRGDFYKSIEDKQTSERITSVLYPNDHTPEGKTLRLKQQYLLVSATMQDLFRRFRQMVGPSSSKEDRIKKFKEFPEYLAVQLNDTHPTLAISEQMRILVDEEDLEWADAWEITNKTFAYTNHTVLPEALERWSVDLLDHLLPRHMKIIYDINYYFLKSVEDLFPGDAAILRKLSIIEEGSPRMIRMAHLAIVGSHSVNGVAAIHSDLLKTEVFPEFAKLYPGKFMNMTNGVTPRRWLHQANPQLSLVISTWLQTQNWIVNLDQLVNLKQYAENSNLQNQWSMVKKQNKQKLANYVEKNLGIRISIDAMFDVQVKRIHEYKRQLMNILYIIHRYENLKKMEPKEREKTVKRVVFFGGKAAPGYFVAKLVIRLINSVAEVINKDKSTNEYLKIIFIPNYCVSLAEIIVPATDISQHISTAGMEASGTSNMKFAMNGSLIIGTLDGANVEIMEEIGKENIFIFGITADQVNKHREIVRKGEWKVDPRLTAVLDSIEAGNYGDALAFQPIINSLKFGNDYYLLSVDFPLYIESQIEVDETYKNQKLWLKKSIMSTGGSGKFSSDRTIKEYASKIWGLEPCRRPGPATLPVEKLSSQMMGMSSPSMSIEPTDSISFEAATPTEKRTNLFHNLSNYPKSNTKLLGPGTNSNNNVSKTKTEDDYF